MGISMMRATCPIDRFEAVSNLSAEDLSAEDLQIPVLRAFMISSAGKSGTDTLSFGNDDDLEIRNSCMP